MHQPGEFSQGNMERWEAEHPYGTHDVLFVPNGIGQIIALCKTCNVFQGLNEVEAGLPIVTKEVADESPNL